MSYTDNFSIYPDGIFTNVDTNWLQGQGNTSSFNISGGLLKVSASSGQSSSIYGAGSGFTQNQYSTINIANKLGITTIEGPGVNLTTQSALASGYYVAVKGNGTWYFVILNNGVGTIMGAIQSGLTLGSNDSYSIANSGGVLAFSKNGITMSYTVSDNTYTAGVPGITCYIGTPGSGDIANWAGGVSNSASVAWF